jgi:glycosyltransferase involved in cell wall biosynthesis
MAGIANGLAKRFDRVQVWSLSINPLLDARLLIRRLLPPDRYWDFREIPLLAFNEALIDQLAKAMADGLPRLIYQRYSLHSFSGVWAAKTFNIPLVLEYNGSEVWMAQCWGDGLRWRALAERVERLNLLSAHTVVVVSTALKKELITRGVDSRRIVVVPNAVDVDMYSTLVASGGFKERVELQGKTVIGFIGTFGRWHGVELLVEAFARLQLLQPADALTCLLLIGDGPTRPLCQDLAQKLGISSLVCFPGLVAQRQGPRWLSTCDVLVSPQIPNPDGSQFFGSPTKIFEYMAMGKPIIASKLGQIEEILEHGKSAWLFEAGDVESLATGLNALISDPALCDRLATNAREQALAHHTWAARVDVIVDRLGDLCD